MDTIQYTIETGTSQLYQQVEMFYFFRHSFRSFA